MTDKERDIVLERKKGDIGKDRDAAKFKHEAEQKSADRAQSFINTTMQTLGKVAAANSPSFYNRDDATFSASIIAKYPNGIPLPDSSNAQEILSGNIMALDCFDTMPYAGSELPLLSSTGSGNAYRVLMTPGTCQLSGVVKIRELWTKARSVNAGFSQTSPDELSYYFEVLTNWIGVYYSLLRCYNLVLAYKNGNKYIPGMLVKALLTRSTNSVTSAYPSQMDMISNVADDLKTLTGTLPTLYARLTSIANLLNSLNIPSLAVIARKAWLYSHIFKDEDSEKASMIFARPMTLYKGDTEEVGIIDAVIDTPTRLAYTTGNGAIGTAISNMINTLFDRIFSFSNSSVHALISGDLAKLAEKLPSEMKFVSVDIPLSPETISKDLDKLLSQIIVYDEEFLHQFWNSSSSLLPTTRLDGYTFSLMKTGGCIYPVTFFKTTPLNNVVDYYYSFGYAAPLDPTAVPSNANNWNDDDKDGFNAFLKSSARTFGHDDPNTNDVILSNRLNSDGYLGSLAVDHQTGATPVHTVTFVTAACLNRVETEIIGQYEIFFRGEVMRHDPATDPSSIALDCGSWFFPSDKFYVYPFTSVIGNQFAHFEVSNGGIAPGYSANLFMIVKQISTIKYHPKLYMGTRATVKINKQSWFDFPTNNCAEGTYIWDKDVVCFINLETNLAMNYSVSRSLYSIYTGAKADKPRNFRRK